MNCLPDDTVHDFVFGQLAESERLVVDTHLDQCEECRALIACLATGSQGAAAQAGDPFALRRGSSLGRYLLLEMVGEGAMGVVFAAYDPELHRKVAVKLLHADSTQADEGQRDRLQTEAQSMARLSHPNVVTIYEIGSTDDSLYIAMELVEGSTLRHWLAQASRSWQEIVLLLAAAGRGLAAAHDAGLVHRDFKPENLLVDAEGRVRVTDFGLARAGETSLSDELGDLALVQVQAMTRTGALMGTPAYMAPEQLRGERATPASDQYAFCLVLYEALYGKRAFSGPNLAELLRASEEDSLKAPGGAVPRWLHAILVRGLAPEPSARFESMPALLAALQPRESKLKIAAAATATILAAGLIVAFLVKDESRARAVALCSDAEQQFDAVWSAEQNDAMAQAIAASALPYAGQMSQALRASFARWRSRWVEEHTATCKATRESGTQSEALLDARMHCLGRELAAFAILGETVGTSEIASLDVARIEQALPDIAACADISSLQALTPPPAGMREAVQAIDLELASAKAMVATGDFGAARAAATQALARARDIDYPLSVASAVLTLASAEWRGGDVRAAREHVQEAIVRSIEAGSDRSTAEAWIASVAIAGELGANQEALHNASLARAALSQLEGSEALRARLANNTGTVYYRMNRFAEARELLEESHRLRLSLDEDSSLVARSLTSLGNLERVSGNTERSLALHQEALALDQRGLGQEHPAIGRHLHNIAGVLRVQGKTEEALQRYREALQLRRKSLGEKHQDVALTLNSLGLVHQELGHDAEAASFYRQALAAYASAEHPQRALSLFGLGVLLARQGAQAQAQERLREALMIFESSYEDSHERVSHALMSLAESLDASGDRAEASALATRVLRAKHPRFAEQAAALLARRSHARVPATPKAASAEPAAAQERPGPIRTPPDPEPLKRGMYGSSPAWD